MNLDEVVDHFESTSDYNLSEIERELEPFSEKELYSCAYKILEKPYKVNEILLIILRKLFEDRKEFVDLFCKFLEEAYDPYYLRKSKVEIIQDVVTERVDIAFNIAKTMINLGDKKGISAGILLFMISDKMEEVEMFVIQGLESENENFQRCSLVCFLYIMNKGIYDIDKYLQILKNVAPNISDENEDQLILSLQLALNIKPDIFQQILESEIGRRGVSAARNYISNYIRMNRVYSENSILLLKKSIEILESNSSDEMWVDWGLAEVYKSDPDFVFKRIETRLGDRRRIRLMDYQLETRIKEIGNGPIIEFIESEIDSHNQNPEYIRESVLIDLFSSQEEWISWCEKWKNDKNKEHIILKLLGLLLTELITYNPDEIRDRAISLVKEFAKNKSLDYEIETKGINLGADKTEGYKNKENAIKALEILDKILNPTIEIEINELESNFKKAPNLCEAFNYKWLIKNAKSSNIHIVNYIFGQDSPISQSYLENVFSLLKEHNIKITKRKLQDINSGKNILTEIEIISQLVPYFKVTPEPHIKELLPKKLDLMIEYGGEKALIEIATVEEKKVNRLSHGAQTYIPGDKIKNELLDKFKTQLHAGKVDVGIPVILLLNLQGFHTGDAVKNGIYGISQFSWKRRTDTNQIVEEGFTRENNGFYDEENSEIITAIGAYKFDMYREDKFVGKLYYPFKPPINKMSLNFRLRLRNALFGNSETSNWKTLMKIPGVDENQAKLLYSNGIDNIDTLISVKENEVLIKGMSLEELARLRSEAIRVIGALSTNKINFLSGINAEDIKILQKEEIYLIRQLLEREKIPERIEEWKWSLLVEDAKRIMQEIP